jgi:outer membrane protein
MMYRKLSRLPLILLGCLVSAGIASAQVKMAIINLRTAVGETADFKKSASDFEGRMKPKVEEMDKLNRDLQSLQQQLETNGAKLTPQAAQDLQIQGQRKQRELQRLTEDLQGERDRVTNDVVGRVTQRMQEVVKKLAEEKGLDVVVDAGNTVFFKSALDITKEAVAAYDQAYAPKS